MKQNIRHVDTSTPKKNIYTPTIINGIFLSQNMNIYTMKTTQKSENIERKPKTAHTPNV